MECKDLYLLFDDEISLEEKKEIIAHLSVCSSCQKEYDEINSVMNDVGELEIAVPSEANEEYFSKMEKNIMTSVSEICKHVQDMLVDYCDSNVSESDREMITSHLGTCSKCCMEFTITSQLLDKNERNEVLKEEYFEILPEKLGDKIFGHIKDMCELAQDSIVNELMDEEIPQTIKRHLDSCPRCQEAKIETKQILESIHELSVPMPSEKYFESLLSKIDNTIEVLPSPRLAEKANQQGVLSSLISALTVVKAFIFQPYTAIATTATIIAIIIGGRMLFNTGNIFERNISTTGMMSSSNTDADVANRKESIPSIDPDLNQQTANMFKFFKKSDSNGQTAFYITDPSSDEKMYIKKKSTAENTQAKPDRDQIKDNISK